MNRTRPLAVTLTLVFLGAMLVPMAPTASAQNFAPEFSFTINGKPTEPVLPIEETANIKVSWTYTLKGTIAQNTAGATGPAVATITVQCNPDQVIMTGSTTALIPIATGGSETTYNGDIDLSITPRRDAEGLVPIVCNVNGQVAAVQSQALPASNPWSSSFQITPDFFALVDAKAPTKLIKAGPQKEVQYSIALNNFGNSQTKVNFGFVEGTGPTTGKWNPLLPDPVLMDPKGGDLASQEALFTVSTTYKNGWNNEEAGFTLLLKPEYSLNSEKKGGEVPISVLTRVRGVYVPALEPMLLAGAVIALALIARRNTE